MNTDLDCHWLQVKSYKLLVTAHTLLIPITLDISITSSIPSSSYTPSLPALKGRDKTVRPFQGQCGIVSIPWVASLHPRLLRLHHFVANCTVALANRHMIMWRYM